MIGRFQSFMDSRGVRLLTFGLLIHLTVFCAGFPDWVQAQDYPNRGITLIYPFVAGVTADIFTRSIAPQLSKKLGVPIDVVCKPGGAGTIGTLEVMKARKDGYTLLIDCPGSASLQKALGSELPYKIEERTFIVRAMACPHAIFVPAQRPWKTLKDVEEAIRKDPANFRWVSAGGTNFSEFTIHLFKTALIARGVDLSQTKSVPFVSSTPANAALAGGHVDIWEGGASVVAPLVDAGKIRLIAVASKERTRAFPGLPTCVEQGYNVVTSFWVGYTGPMGLPKNVAERWVNVVKEIVNDPANLPAFEKVGGEPAFLAMDDFRKFVFDEAKEVDKMTAAAKGK